MLRKDLNSASLPQQRRCLRKWNILKQDVKQQTKTILFRPVYLIMSMSIKPLSSIIIDIRCIIIVPKKGRKNNKKKCILLENSTFYSCTPRWPLDASICFTGQHPGFTVQSLKEKRKITIRCVNMNNPQQVSLPTGLLIVESLLSKQ